MSDPSVADTPPSATSIVGIGTNPKRAKPLQPTGQDTADTRELIIFLTGLSAHVPGEEGNRFAAGIKNAMGKLGFDTRLAGKQVKNPNLKQDADQGDSDNDPNETATENRPGLLEEYTRTCVLVNRDASHDDRRRVRTIDVSELFWNRQLKAKLSTLPTRNRVIEGGRLLLYWLFSPRFLGSLLRGKNFLGLSIVGPAFLLVAWYWGVVAAGLTAIGSEGWSWIGAIAGTENLFPGLRAMAADLGKWMGGWTAWLATSTLIAAFGVNYAVDAPGNRRPDRSRNCRLHRRCRPNTQIHDHHRRRLQLRFHSGHPGPGAVLPSDLVPTHHFGRPARANRRPLGHDAQRDRRGREESPHRALVLSLFEERLAGHRASNRARRNQVLRAATGFRRILDRKFSRQDARQVLLS
jgi:hypothetical protein